MIFKKLDWCFIDSSWRTAFPEAKAEVLYRSSSDHHPILVRCGPLPSRGPRPFRFEAAWLTHEGYEGLVRDGWGGDGDVPSKLEAVKDRSLAFNKETFGNIFIRKHDLEARISGVQRKLETVDSAATWRLHDSLEQDLERVLKQEEMLWFQKSREQSFLLGDRNTKYFHTQAIVRRRRNKIHALNLPSGEFCDQDDVPKREALLFHKSLFCSQVQVAPCSMISAAPPPLTNAWCFGLVQPVSKEEVWKALSSMQPFKSPGPDGFQEVFFKNFWHIVGDDVWHLVRDAFESRFFAADYSETLIALIPKVDVPSNFKELRPISLCNVVYKLITKVLVARIRPFFTDCLDKYLGFPIFSGRQSRTHFQYVVDRVGHKLSSWKSNL